MPFEWCGADTFRDNRNGREIEPGTVVELDDRVAGPHPEFVEVDGGDGDDADTGADTPPVDPTALSVDELHETLTERELDAEDLDAIAAAERGTDDPRTTALDAIDSARE